MPLRRRLERAPSRNGGNTAYHSEAPRLYRLCPTKHNAVRRRRARSCARFLEPTWLLRRLAGLELLERTHLALFALLVERFDLVFGRTLRAKKRERILPIEILLRERDLSKLFAVGKPDWLLPRVDLERVVHDVEKRAEVPLFDVRHALFRRAHRRERARDRRDVARHRAHHRGLRRAHWERRAVAAVIAGRKLKRAHARLRREHFALRTEDAVVNLEPFVLDVFELDEREDVRIDEDLAARTHVENARLDFFATRRRVLHDGLDVHLSILGARFDFVARLDFVRDGDVLEGLALEVDAHADVHRGDVDAELGGLLLVLTFDVEPEKDRFARLDVLEELGFGRHIEKIAAELSEVDRSSAVAKLFGKMRERCFDRRAGEHATDEGMDRRAALGVRCELPNFREPAGCWACFGALER